MTDVSVARRGPSPWVIAVGFAVLLVVGLLWAKWVPYWFKVPSVAASGSLGSSIVTGGAPAPPGVSLRAGLQFAGTYFPAIWPALVVGLVLAAAVSAALPADWLRRVFADSGVRGAALSLPGMMCSCCAAPIAVGLRRKATSLVPALAFWIGNPALNPVVLAFCAFVLPWPWTVLRLVGGVVVVAATIALGRRWGSDVVVPGAGSADPGPETADDRPLPQRFLRSLGGLSVRLLPEYLLIVVALGALRGVLFPFSSALVEGGGLALLVLGVVLLAVAGTLLPIPTGAEVAVVAAMLAIGVAAPFAAVLLITLPVVSLPSALMVRRVFPRGLLVAVMVAVAGVGLVCAALAAPL